MIKRICSSVLAVILILSFFSVSYADTTWTEDVEEKYQLLNALDILPDREYGDYGVFRDLSKSGFINFVCNIYGGNNFTEEHSDEAIKIAEDAGLIHKEQTDLYKPICYEEAITILVRLLGYETHAQIGGGFPYGYTKLATSLGLTDGIVSGMGETLREHDVVKLLYNLINCAYVEIKAITDDGIIYGNASDKTILHELRGIYRIDGVLEGTGTAVIKEGMSVSDDRIMIDGYLYKAENDYSEYLGYDVTAYVQEYKSGDDTVILLLPDDNNELVIYSDDIEVVSDDFKKIGYYSDDKLKTASISSVASVLYNGQLLENYTKEKFTPEDGEIRLIENGGGSGYDVVLITSYKTIVAEYVSGLNKSIKNAYTYDAENLTLSFEQTGEDVFRIVSDSGELEFSDLTVDDVLRVAESVYEGKRVVTVSVSQKKISGTVTGIRNGDYTIVTMDGKDYTLSMAYEAALEAGDANAEEIKIGGGYVFSLDSTGRIAYAEDSAEVVKYGIVMATAVQGALLKECKVKLFTTEGEWKELVFADKIKYNDGVNGEKSGILPENIIDNIKTATQGDISVIAYMTNSEGKIRSIEIPSPYSKNTADKFNATESAQYNYRVNNRSFDSEVFIKDDAVMWSVNPDKLTDEKAYSLTSRSALVSDGIYVLSAYNIDEFKFSDLFVMQNNNTTRDNAMLSSDLFVVKETGETLNSDGESVGMLTGMSGAYDTLSYSCEDWSLINGLKKGDTLVVHSDSNGNLDYLIKYRSASDGEVYQNPSAMHSSATILQGRVVKNDCSGYRMIIDCKDAERVIRTDASTLVIIYDTKTDEIYRGSVADIEEDAFITTKLVRSQLKSIVVYQ